MKKFFNSKLKSKLYFDHRTHTIPKTVVKNKIIDDILKEEKLVVGNDVLRK